MKYQHPCPECDGLGETECCECGSALNCELCQGEGIDGSVVDLMAFEAEVNTRSGGGGRCCLMEGDICVGSKSYPFNNQWTVRYDSFLRSAK